ncbi:NADH dehydrogenase subunit H [Candidatus Kryptonium thompsonii]|jgi:NADH-quinone oxidoreductase subunit H|uniref:NADH-quinone oxidoreductase subunit H n=1 Tax=Candidatus Kryptonium thompsonii TaxID=1633631 RepID=A0A0P1LL96_9BACT|nr:NADH-quinone oxidoreductase subunit NuoH [Candidatus Kryptonium thompsoni]CUS77697.1 NADH dehydrogenase subunit H [Candidatus Kryptonium thompsoni]CUS82239.1 NADH dehydrogenase subunit H [Candidatus Kryptonium thompsoni]CUS84055.1 NADH dehydrogenase subunit H [Candidatus Kryptonium thompsoni]CUS88854.1 NADH dehydrogenase subunit H [Candidatus Kryptonium thompsoni]CUS89459.1 NADH dehydrogenase subunit H [Candidatus Kryptonium thompsoni]
METLLIIIVKSAIFIILFLTASAALTYVERRISAFIQDRLGPNRVGPFGLFQPIADVIKIIFKEEIIPANADRTLHTIAPIISLFVAYSVFAVLPLGESLVIGGREIKLILADVNVGFLYILALSSIGVYGVTLSGWASNNKYSLLGALRASAQMISYELSLGLSLVGVVLVAGSIQIDEIIRSQANVWNIFYQPVGFIIFLVSAFAETNRLPFDLPEAEPELVAGYHTEYSGMKFGAFYLAEYTNIITASLLVTAFYLGGWYFPFFDIYRGMNPNLAGILQVIVFFVKAFVIIFLFMLVRWTLPRFRYDQLMRLGWQVLLPLALLNVLVTGLVKIIL